VISGEHAIWNAAMGEIRWAWIFREFAKGPTMGEAMRAIEKPLVRAVNQAAEAYAKMGRDMTEIMRRAIGP